MLLGLLGFALPIIYVPWFADAVEGPRWSVLAVVVGLSCAVWVLCRLPRRLTAGHALGGLFLAWAWMSLAWTFAPMDGLKECLHFLVLAGLFCISAQIKDMRALWIGAGLGLAVNTVVILAVRFDLLTIFQLLPDSGLFMNKTLLVQAAAVVFVALVAYRRFGLALLIAPCFVLQGERSPFVAICVAGAVWLWDRSRVAALALGLLIGGAAIGTAYVDPGFASRSDQRTDIWHDTVDGMRAFGNGAGAFYLLYPAHSTRHDMLATRPVHAENDFLEFAYDYGIGVLPLAGLIVLAFGGARRPEHYALAAFLVCAAFNFASFNSTTAALAALSCGALYRDRAQLRLGLDAGRIRIRRGLAWADRSRRRAAAA